MGVVVIGFSFCEMSYTGDNYSGITPEIALHKSVTVNGGLIAKKMAIGEGNNRLVVKEDGVYIGCPCKFNDEGAPVKEEIRYYSLHAVIEAIQELNRRTAWMDNDMGISESIALTDQLGDNNVDTYHSTTKDLLPGLRNLNKPETLRDGTLDRPFSEITEWVDGIWTYTFDISDEDDVTFGIKRSHVDITDDNYVTPYGMITDSTGKQAKVTDTNSMLYGCNKLISLDASEWDTINVTDMHFMFNCCSSLALLDVSNWDTGKVTDMNNMFYHCTSLKELDVSNWDTSSVTKMDDMFNGCVLLKELDVSGWNTALVVDMHDMFYGCRLLTSLDVSGWDTGEVKDMKYMFYGCRSLTSLDMSNWDTSNVTDMNNMFVGCGALTTVTISRSGANMLSNLLELSDKWVIKGTTTTMATVMASSNWIANFGSDTLTFTRTA